MDQIIPKYNITLMTYDFETSAPKMHLNDKIVDFYVDGFGSQFNLWRYPQAVIVFYSGWRDQFVDNVFKITLKHKNTKIPHDVGYIEVRYLDDPSVLWQWVSVYIPIPSCCQYI